MTIKEVEQMFLECKYDEALPEFERLAETGETRAYYFLGEYYTWAYGHTAKDKEKAREYRRMGSEAGDILSRLNYAYSYPSGSFERYSILDDVAPLVEELANSGDLFAQNEIADCYISGYGVKKNVDIGLEWMTKSSNGGYGRSTNKLANDYYNGTYGTKDYDKAVELYKKAMNQGYPAAFYNMGSCYYNGYGVEQSYDEAISLYKKAYELGYSDAACQLAGMYKDGVGVPVDKEQEISWYTKGADLGDAECQFFLGRMYHLATGVDADYAKAIKWYELSANQGFAKAQNNLGNMYSDGLGVEKDRRKAKELYYLAAKGGAQSANDNIINNMLVRAAVNSYTVSDSVKRKIQNIPSFKTDVYKIKSVSSVKSIYGISDDETIISYRVIPKLLAKLETGGAVFTDKGVYKRLSSGLLSNNYVTYGIAYDELIRYLPALGYSESQQPQLVGKHESKKNLSFWLTPVMGTESNQEIVDVFWEIITEIVALDEEKKLIFEKTQNNLLLDCNYSYEKEGRFSSDDEDIIKQLVRRGLLNQTQKEHAVYLIYANQFAKGNYSIAYDYVNSNSAEFNQNLFELRLEKIVKRKIDEIGVPTSYGDVEALKLFCIKNEEYIDAVWPRIISYYFNENSCDSVDEFLSEFEGSPKFDLMVAALDQMIDETLPEKMKDWEDNPYSSSDEAFVMYALHKPKFYRMAAQELVKHYCVLGEFDDAISSLDKVKEAEDNESLLEELRQFVKEYTVVYAENQYKKACDFINANDTNSAIPCLQEAVKYDLDNQEYALLLIKTEIETASYAQAKSDIQMILGQARAFSDENLENFQSMQVECAEGLSQEMSAFYDLIAGDNASSLSNDSSTLAKKDQLGLSFYHYAILLKKDEVVGRINVENTSAKKAVCGYQLECFACDDDTADNTFVQLLKLYDDDAKQLYKAYKRRKATNTAKEIGAGIFNAVLDSAISSASNMDSRMRDMQRDRTYSSHYDEIQDKRYQAQDARDQFKDMKAQFNDYTDENIADKDDIYNDYVNQLIGLSLEKIVYWCEQLRENLNASSMQSKIIYLIIKNPKWLEEIFHGDRDKFALHQDNGEFFYMPEALLIEAGNLKVSK